MAKLVPKTLEQQLSALEDHLFLLARTTRELATGEPAHVKQLATQLRALICTSSGMPGLLWRLSDEVVADDRVLLRYPGKVDTSNPLTQGLMFACAEISADGSGPEAVPAASWSFKKHIHEHEALFVDGMSISHEYLISRLANETGIAHEAHGVSKEIAKLNSVLQGNIQPYFKVLDTDARLTLLVGDKVLRAGEAQGYVRRRPPSLPEDIPALASSAFSSRLDVPSVSSSHLEGTILMVLKLPKRTALEQSLFPIRFAPFTQGEVTVRAEMSRSGRIHVSSQGLPLSNFGFEFYPPEPDADSLAIAISWKGLDTKAFAGGRQVAGSIKSTDK